MPKDLVFLTVAVFLVFSALGVFVGVIEGLRAARLPLWPAAAIGGAVTVIMVYVLVVAKLIARMLQ